MANRNTTRKTSSTARSTTKTTSGTRSTRSGSGRKASGSQSASRAGTGKSTSARKTRQPQRSTGRASTGRAGSSRVIEGPSGASDLKEDFILIAVIAVLIFLFLANFGILGPVGNAIRDVFFGLFGLCNWILPVFVAGTMLYGMANRRLPDIRFRILALVGLFLCLSIACELGSRELVEHSRYNLVELYQRCSETKAGGGALAGSLAFALFSVLKMVGSILVLLFVVLLCVMTISGQSLIKLIQNNRARNYDYEYDEDEAESISDPYPEEEEETVISEEELSAERERRRRAAQERALREEEEQEELSRRERERILEARRRKEEQDRIRAEKEAELAELRRRRADQNLERTERVFMKQREKLIRQREEEQRLYREQQMEMERARLAREEAENASILRPMDTESFARRMDELRISPDGEEEVQSPAAIADPMEGMVIQAAAETVAAAGSTAATSHAFGEGSAPAPAAPTPVEASPVPGYSVSGDLHEIHVSDVDYSLLQARADVRRHTHEEEAHSYTGIGVPSPERVAGDYLSEDFSQRIVDQGMASSLEVAEQESSSAVREPAPAPVLETPDFTPVNMDEEHGFEELRPGMAPKTPDEKPEDILQLTPETPMVVAVDDQPITEGALSVDEPVDAPEPFKPQPPVETAAPAPQSPAVKPEAAPAAEAPAKADPAAQEAAIEEIIVDRKREEDLPKAKAPQPGSDAMDIRVPKQAYVYPKLALLKPGDRSHQQESDRELQETAYNLQNTLKTFGMDVTIPQVSQGPAVTRYELLPAQGVRVSKIVALADDIKLNLAAADIRIEAPIPGKQAIGIEVPNKVVQTVTLRELFEFDGFVNFKGGIPFAVGKDIGGNIIVSDITKMPHVLIAGATGSGKSVCINTMVMSILYHCDPEDVRMIMIDPKVVELSVYNGIPHLLLPVVTDPKKASAALQWAVAEMEQRYRLFADKGVRDLKGYNQKMLSEGNPKIPQIVIIVDELADLMMVCHNEVEESICRLAQLARAAGIHLVIATQRPSVDVITGLIKANMPSRIAFQVSQGVDSRTILDMNGAEKLLGKGDMLFYPSGYQKPVRIQGAFVTDGEVERVVEEIRRNNPPQIGTSELESKIEAMSAGSAGIAGTDNTVAAGSEYDEHFVEAGYAVIEKEKATIGMLQRMFKIGFNRAARMMDQLCEAGVVSEEEGTKPRRVLMSRSDFESFIEENNV